MVELPIAVAAPLHSGAQGVQMGQCWLHTCGAQVDQHDELGLCKNCKEMLIEEDRAAERALLREIEMTGDNW